MQDAKRSISLATAEFKAATAGLDKWQKSTTGLEAKLKQLNSTLPQQKKILADLEKQYEITSKEMGENSAEAQRLKIQIENQRGAIAKTEASINKYNAQLKQLKAEEEASNSATGKLNKTIQEQQNRLNDLKGAYQNAVLQYGKNSKEAQSLANEIEKLSSELADNKKKMNDAEKASNELDKSIDDAADSANEAASGGFTVLKGAMANLVAQGISKAIDGLKRLASEVVEIGKQSISNYAEYEQLVGGVETLFKDSAGVVEKYADNAYKTAGMSANKYMETVTSFSASLLQGLGGDTEKAANIADLAITDMSDNANKMGTSMDLIQNAYQGFAKNNFTMLDNLKLGYGGTQTEMIRLINDSGILEKKIKKIDEVSFDQMILAIHEIQNQIGITGTTAAEAADTIEGSKNSMSASWSNLLTEISKSDGDIGAAFDTFVDSAMTYLQNLLPRVKELMDNVISLIREKLEESAPELLSFFDMIADGFKWILDNKDVIIAALGGIGAAFVAWNLVSIVQSVLAFAKALQAMGLQAAFAAAKQWLLNTALFANPIGLVVAAIAGLVAAFVILWNKSEAFREFWINLWEKVKEIASSAWKAISGFFADAWVQVQEIWGGITEFFSGIWESIKGIFSTVATWINEHVFQPIINFFKPVIDFYVEAWTIIFQLAKGCWEAIKIIWSAVKDWFNENIIVPVKEFFVDLWTSITTKAQETWDSVKSIWNVVSTWFNDTIVSPISNYFSNMWENLKSGASDAWSAIKDTFGSVADWFKDKFSVAWQNVKDVFSTGGKIFDGIKEGIEEAFKTVVNAIIRGINKVIAIPFNAINNTLDKIRDVEILGFSPFKGLISRFSVPEIPTLATGGVLKKGQLGLLEGNGAEAVVPLEKNKQWIAKVVKEVVNQMNLNGVKSAVSRNVSGMNDEYASNNIINKTQNVTFNQYNTSPKALDRLTIYRDTNNLLFSAKVRMSNV